MRAADIKTIKFKDNLAAKRRQRVMITGGAVIAAALGVLVFVGWALFFSSWFTIRTVTVSGLSPEHQTEIQGVIDRQVSRTFLKIPVGKNILFFRTGSLVTSLEQQFSYLQDLSAHKQYFHALVFEGTERRSAGVWCFDQTQQCRYFDPNGVLFGDAARSSGFLVLNIDDNRIASSQPAAVDTNFFKTIQTVVPALQALGYAINDIQIPQDTFVEFDVVTKDYPIKFSLDSDIASQLTVLKIFKEKQIDSGLIHPQYLDLRYDGRVYYK